MIYSLLHTVLDLLFQALYLALFIRVILSWIPHDPYHSIVKVLYQVTDPLLRPFQDIVPTYKIGIDLSPIFAFLALGFIKKVIFSLLFY